MCCVDAVSLATEERRGIANRPTDWRSDADLVGEADTELGGKSSFLLPIRSTQNTERHPWSFVKPSSSPQVGHEEPSRPGSLSS
ncbi:hypothetical protein PBY51_014295 [Eleginops maclovinus]|uniref:Uncharacterized protein n=1 Tax=Eleginops maclovinus TaxID=56733 RepID=A0AAN7WMA4_ELEMC|nr:hypothetical protein PBY51_014295 [Eleginops maclovinus]